MKAKAVLTINVKYDVPSESYTPNEARREIRGLLGYVPHHAADNGLLSGFSEMTVDTWSHNVSIIVEADQAESR